ncbi:MAG: VOC family protein [Promethearchaeota archaeon]|nr:MAG: VOC family protein [Candidatus Lokiarchaeota archaeon]
MKVEHIAVASNSEAESDKFFTELLGLNKIRSFTVSEDLMEQFFGVNKEHQLIRYEGGNMSFEIIITNDKTKCNDKFTHVSLLVDDKENFIKKASSLGFTTIKIPRKNSEGFYYFVRDYFRNLYEIK